MSQLDFTIFFVFLIFLLIVGIISSKNINNQAQYLVANRDTKIFQLIATLVMTEFNATTFVSHAAAGYSAGLRALALPAVLLVCLLFYAVTVAKKWKAFNGESIANYFSIRYSKLLGRFAAICFIFVMLGLTSTFIKSFCILLNSIFAQYNSWIISAFLVLVVGLITIRGGLKSIICIDTISFIAILIFMPIMIYFCLNLANSNMHVVNKTWTMPHQTLPIKFIASFMPFCCLCYLASPWYGQKIVSANSENVSYKAVIYAAIFLFFLYGSGVFCSKVLFDKGVALEQSNDVLGYIISQVLPNGFKGFGIAIIFIISTTAISSAWNVMTALIIGDVKSRNKNSFKLNILLTTFWCITSYLIANLLIDDVYSKMILINIPLGSFSFAILGGFYWKATNNIGAIVSILVGIISGGLAYYYYGQNGNWLWVWMITGMPLVFLSGTFFSYFLNKIPFAHKNHHYSPNNL